MDVFHIYIIYSTQLDLYYVGQTNNLERRLLDHRNSRSNYTKRAKDWILVYFESFESRSDALRREKEIKAKKSRKYIEYLIEKG
ncbi:MAG TPA: GIY-YIG nuclease family protein [Moheibacter sp.]|nr:GIY-YIG nuclease family protein [Moheibacter sp.]